MRWFKKKELGLVESAAKGDLTRVAALLQGGINPDAKDLDDSKTTALLVAAGNGHDDVVKSLITAGATVDLRVGEMTPLMLAAFRGYSNVVITLLKAGADPNAEG